MMQDWKCKQSDGLLEHNFDSDTDRFHSQVKFSFQRISAFAEQDKQSNSKIIDDSVESSSTTTTSNLVNSFHLMTEFVGGKMKFTVSKRLSKLILTQNKTIARIFNNNRKLKNSANVRKWMRIVQAPLCTLKWTCLQYLSLLLMLSKLRSTWNYLDACHAKCFFSRYHFDSWCVSRTPEIQAFLDIMKFINTDTRCSDGLKA